MSAAAAPSDRRGDRASVPRSPDRCCSGRMSQSCARARVLPKDVVPVWEGAAVTFPFWWGVPSHRNTEGTRGNAFFTVSRERRRHSPNLLSIRCRWRGLRSQKPLRHRHYCAECRPASWDARRLARRLACRVMCTPHGCSAEHPMFVW